MANIEIFWRQLLISFHDADQINKKMSTMLLPNKEQNKTCFILHMLDAGLTSKAEKSLGSGDHRDQDDDNDDDGDNDDGNHGTGSC